MRLIYTAGVFDLLHRGHLNILWESKALGDMLVVGVVSDAGAFAYKGRMPVESSQLRERNVGAVACVDMVVSQPDRDPRAVLERIRPDVFTHADGAGSWGDLREMVESLGIEYMNLPYTPGISTTDLRAEATEWARPLRFVASQR